MHNIYVIVALALLLGFILGRLLHKAGLTEVLVCLFAGIIIGPILNFSVSEQFSTLVTGITLASIAYTVELVFLSFFLKKMGKKILTILIAEVSTFCSKILA